VACCRTKRACFAKSSPTPRPATIQNTYSVALIDDRSTASSGYETTDGPVSTTPSIAATEDRIDENDTAAVSAGLPPTTGNGHVVNIPDATVQYVALWNASSPNVTFVPQHHPAPQAQLPVDGSGSGINSNIAAGCRDSGLTLVENTLYDASDSRRNDEAAYVNVKLLILCSCLCM